MAKVRQSKAKVRAGSTNRESGDILPGEEAPLSPEPTPMEPIPAEPTPVLRIPPPSFLAEAGLSAVLGSLPGARIVGGAVRDTLLARPVIDIDLATAMPPAAVIAALEQAGLRAVPTGLSHGTVTAVGVGKSFEITALRHDIETDGRHAEVAFTSSWQADASRRDFTLNALYLTPAGAVFDYYGGLADLISGRLRFVGRPEQRIAEDRLRVLRYFRFFAHYGQSAPDRATYEALKAAASELGQLSAERVWSELKRLLAAPDPSPALTLMRRAGILAAILPEARELGALALLSALGAPPDPMLRLAALVGPGAASTVSSALADRLRFSTAEAERLARLLAGPVPSEAADAAEIRRLLAQEPAETLIERTLLAGVGGLVGGRLRARLATTPRPVFPLAGRDALALGAREGPAVGAALGQVRAWWLAGGCVADPGACRAELLRRLGA
ncbi:MAG: CCA tRNA nucleotidyltransferase [Acetobacteraceae bacterium]